jgi:hypothetical protein
VFVARATTLWELTRLTVPELYGAFTGLRIMLGTPRAQPFIEQLYGRLPSVNFSSADFDAVCVALAGTTGARDRLERLGQRRQNS